MDLEYDVPESQKDLVSSDVLVFLLVLIILVYSIGVYLHTNILITAKKEKDVSYQLDVVNSVVILFHFAHFIIIAGAKFLIKDLYTHTGEWLCYTSKFVRLLGGLQVASQSLVISLLKYSIIVCHEKTRAIGRGKVQNVFLVLNMLYPICIIGSFAVAKNNFLTIYDNASEGNSCLVKISATNETIFDKNQHHTKLFNICDMIELPNQKPSELIFNVGKKSICWISLISVYLNACNIPEAFIYCLIFRFMRR